MVRLSIARVTRTGSGGVGADARLLGHRLDHIERQTPVGAGEDAVEVDLPGREGDRSPWARAGFEFRRAGEVRRTRLRSVLEFEIVGGGPGGGRLDLGGDLPGLVDGGGAVRQRGADHARYGHGAFETRRICLDPHDAVGIERHRRRGRIDKQAQLNAAVVAAPAATDAKCVRPLTGGKVALALERTEQRAHLAVEIEIVEREPTAAGGVGENDMAVRHREPVDADAIGIKAQARDRRHDAAGPVELQRRLEAVDVHLVGAELAPHQAAETEFHGELAGGNRGCLGSDLDRIEAQRRRRQQTDRNRAGHPYRCPDDPARLRLKDRAIAVPVDEKRADQGRSQGQDDGDADSK